MEPMMTDGRYQRVLERAACPRALPRPSGFNILSATFGNAEQKRREDGDG
jgi:hypothetical protein